MLKIETLEALTYRTYIKMINTTDYLKRNKLMVRHYKLVRKLDELELENRRYRKDAGFTMLETLMALVIAGILMQALFSSLILTTKTAVRLEKANAVAANTNAQALTQWRWIAVPNLGECKAGDAQYFIARTASRTITLYTNSTCTSSVGTLNATDNSHLANDHTKTLWEVSGDTNTLRVLLITFP